MLLVTDASSLYYTPSNISYDPADDQKQDVMMVISAPRNSVVSTRTN